MQEKVIHKLADNQFPFKPPRILLKKPVIKHQKSRIVLAVAACKKREKIIGQNRKNAGWHLPTVSNGVKFVKVVWRHTYCDSCARFLK